MDLSVLLKTPSLFHSLLSARWIFADIIPSYRCNLRCKMCSYWKKKYDIKKELKPEDYAIVADKIKKLGSKFVLLTGGEPFLKAGINKIVNTFSKSFFTFIVSNGTLIDRKIARELYESGLFSVAISIDSLTKKHNEQRGVKGVLKKAIKSLEILKDEMGDRRVGISTVITSMNENEIEDLVNFAKEKEVKINFNFFAPIMQDMQDGKGSDLAPKRPFKIIDQILKLKRKCPGVISSSSTYLKKAKMFYKGNLHVCRAGKLSFAIGPYGNITRCTKFKDRIAGNIINNSVKEIRKNLLNFLPPSCNSCWVSCRGEVETIYLNPFEKIISHIGEA